MGLLSFLKRAFEKNKTAVELREEYFRYHKKCGIAVYENNYVVMVYGNATWVKRNNEANEILARYFDSEINFEGLKNSVEIFTEEWMMVEALREYVEEKNENESDV